MPPLWYELVKRLERLQTRAESQNGQTADSLARQEVASLLEQAKDAASKNSDWSSSGLPESLQRAQDLCDKQGPSTAIAAALRLLDFQHIVEAKSSSSPKSTSPKQGTSVNSVAELQVPQLQSQLPDADSRTSLPVITIRKATDSQAVPSTTTILLQHSPVTSALPPSRPAFEPKVHPASSVHSLEHASHRLSVLKSKNGRTILPQAAGSKDSKPDQDTAVSPSAPVKSTVHGKRPISAHQHRSSAPEEQQHPMRAKSPPPADAATTSDAADNGDQPNKHVRCQQPNPSPFEAPEAQLQEARGSNSDKSTSSNTNSDKSAGHAGRTRSREEEAVSSDDSNGSKRQKRNRMERVVSMGTVLRCVETHTDRQDNLDDAVGEIPATVHEMTEGAAAALQARRTSTECTADAQQLLQKLYGQPVAGDGKLEGRSSDEELQLRQPAKPNDSTHNKAGQPEQATVSIVLSPAPADASHAMSDVMPVSSQATNGSACPALGPQLRLLPFPTLPLSAPPPLVQIPMIIPPLKVELTAGSRPGFQQHSQQAPQLLSQQLTHQLPHNQAVLLKSASRSSIEQGSLATTLWSGKVKHKLGKSTVDLFYMTALIPEQYLEQFPPSLYVTSLATQKDVKLGRHFVMRCRLDFLTEKQLGKLQMLAQGKVVAICRLQHCTITLVPYWDKTRALRVVGFMLAHD